MNAEQAESRVRLAARLYEARDTIRRLAGNNYAAKIAEWKDALVQIRANLACETIEVVPRLKVTENGRGRNEIDGVAWLWLLAATVELIEAGE